MSRNTKFDLDTMLSAPAINPQYAEAAKTHAEIMNCAAMAQQNLYQMALGFKKMRDERLYEALGYNNFGEYCEKETGMRRRNVYNYIAICEKLPSDFVQSTAQIGMQKLQLLTTISDEQREEITEAVDLESTTVKELKAKIEELKAEKDKAQAEINKENQQLRTDRVEAMNRADNAERVLSKAKNDNADLQKKIHSLESEIKELESRPIEVAVQDDSEKAEQLLEEQQKHAEELADLHKQIDILHGKLDKAKSDMGEQEERDENYVFWLAALRNAKSALLDLTIACARYDNTFGYRDARNLAEKFISDIDNSQNKGGMEDGR